MLDNGNVDYPTLKILLEEQNKAKNGILILGSTGESFNINEELEWLLDLVKIFILIIPGAKKLIKE